MRRSRLVTVVGVVAAGAAWAGCGSSGSTSATGATGSTTSSTAAPTTGPSTTAAPSTLTLVTSGLPAVSNTTNLKAEPLPAAGTSPAPAKLLGQDRVVGTGTTAADGMTVEVQYVGANYADGKVFDASWARGQPASFPLNGVMWDPLESTCRHASLSIL